MILITRPRNKSLKLINKLKDHDVGFHCDSLFSFSNKKTNLNLNEFSDCIIVSSQAVEVLKKNYRNKIKFLNELKVHVIGSEVKKKLKEIGIFNIKYTAKDSSELIKYFKDKNLEKNKFCYLGSNIENTKLLNDLNLLGINYKKICLYYVVPKKKFLLSTISLMKREKITAVLIYSTFTAQRYLQLVDDASLRNKVCRIKYFCLSKEISKTLLKGGYKNVTFSNIPTENSLLKKLLD